jgi:hypothetical protein
MLYGEKIKKENGSKFSNDSEIYKSYSFGSTSRHDSDNCLIRTSSYKEREISIYDMPTGEARKSNDYFGNYNNNNNNNNNSYYNYKGGYNRNGFNRREQPATSIYEDKNGFRKSCGTITTGSTQNKVAVKNNNLHILSTHYEGMCNYLIFSKACTPNIDKSEADFFDLLNLESFLGQFDRISAFGLDANYLLESKCSI